MKLSLRRRALIVNGALAVLLAGGVGAAYASLTGETGAGAALPATVAVTRGTVMASVSASGSVESARTRSLDFTGGGTVESINVKAGDRVKKGQVLARLDDTEAAENLDAARASLEAAEDGDTGTASGYSQYVNALNAYKQAKRAYEGTVLKAPFSGTIISVNGTAGGSVGGSSGGTGGGSTGSTASTGSTTGATGSGGFIELADTGKLRIVGTFTEADVTRLKVGQAATVSFDALPGVSAGGKVTQIDPVAQTSDNVVRYPVTISLSDVPAQVRLGQTASVQVVVDRAEDVLTVPSTAVRTAGGQSTVILVRGGTQTTARVEVGVKGDQATEIRSGLNEGDLVVRQANATATTGQQGFPGLGGGLGGGVRIGGGGGNR
ncbi:macrolide-specific efflux system membrane fusion protein [Thermocatellispora tengchongensis]|uniref:Macrolide-specific efflux system membrane fusion protein n=1 Tax=Thermocatellispora tengchongensis TaxID=1073253 RepID=A0A840PP89_9ACTN|nr:HlyD family efflux transporter periplasmic adaptor subunit [Thermocatellispora tengchongensis]MBB5139530.1 macrolide-specific efflux system membrane fusion protein [Thermocatellispora tengchongensis]